MSIQKFYENYVLVPVDKTANNDVVVWLLYYINELNQEHGKSKHINVLLLMRRLFVISGYICLNMCNITNT